MFFHKKNNNLNASLIITYFKSLNNFRTLSLLLPKNGETSPTQLIKPDKKTTFSPHPTPELNNTSKSI